MAIFISAMASTGWLERAATMPSFAIYIRYSRAARTNGDDSPRRRLLDKEESLMTNDRLTSASAMMIYFEFISDFI